VPSLSSQYELQQRSATDPRRSPIVIVCLVPPAGIGHVEAIALKLEKMPPKSTYFYPKLLSGLVLNPLG
jgi:uncharacterized protein (DUF1015 family)